MARRLPSLNQLRAFEAAARHLSFKDAADELHVTHAAVSHQIKALEEYLGCKLFHRLTREVRLSEPGASYAPELTRAFDAIVEATSRIAAGGMRGVLKVSVAPFYGNRWLLPRLHRFHERYPDIQVRPELEFNVIDLGKGDVDACLRYGLGPWRGLDAIALHEDRIGPVCSPKLVAGRKLPLSPADIRQLPLAAAAGRDEDWVDWFATAGLPGRAVVPAVEYQNRALTLDFALSGNGVALADVQFSDSDIVSGHLVRLHPLTIKRTRGMYLVYPKSGLPDPRIVVFGEWIREEVSGGSGG